jgi:hypothetical protein
MSIPTNSFGQVMLNENCLSGNRYSNRNAKVTTNMLDGFEQVQDKRRMFPENRALDQVIGLIGLPRSGTTVITSFLAVHSEINAVYEPWNASKNDETSCRVRTIDGFVRRFAPALNGKTTLLIKETSTRPNYPEALGDVLETVRPPLKRRLIVPLRNPFHVFLSECEARRKWHGHADLALSAMVFDQWAERTLRSMKLIAQMARRFGALFLSYECFVEKPPVRVALMSELGLPYEPVQDAYERHVRRRGLRGDRSISKNPAPISIEPVERRTVEATQVEPVISSANRYTEILRIAKLTSAWPETGIATGYEFPQLGKTFGVVIFTLLRSVFEAPEFLDLINVFT